MRHIGGNVYRTWEEACAVTIFAEALAGLPEIVLRTPTQDGHEVSTIRLHGWYETCVFNANGNGSQEHKCMRRESAMDEHRRLVDAHGGSRA